MKAPKQAMTQEEWTARWAEASVKMIGKNKTAFYIVTGLLKYGQITALLRLEELEFGPRGIERLYVSYTDDDPNKLIEILALWSDRKLEMVRDSAGGPHA